MPSIFCQERMSSSTRYSPGSVTTTRSGSSSAAARATSPCKAAAVVRIVQLDIANGAAALAQLGREVPHRREEKRDLLRVMRHMVGLGRHLGEQDDVTIGSVRECGKLGGELIGEDEA